MEILYVSAIKHEAILLRPFIILVPNYYQVHVGLASSDGADKL